MSIFKEAQTLIPGGVNSPVRAFGAVGQDPLFIKSAQGAYLTDTHNRQFIDYVGGFGPMILGHANPLICDAISKAAQHGFSYGSCHPLEVKMAQLIQSIMPSIEMLRMVNSGTEAAMTAVRLARAATKKNKVIKFTGCYHGHCDALLVDAGSGAATLGIPSSPGIPQATTADTLTVEYNDIDRLSAAFLEYPDDIAAVFIEPICGNMGFVLPNSEFLDQLQALCQKHQSLLVFDEVMTGFRVALGGAQSLYDITPDITILGKIIGGGLPVGAIGGKKSILSQLAPSGPVYQAGTLSGNPITLASGYATLSICKQEAHTLYPQLNDYAKVLTTNIKSLAKNYHIPIQTAFKGGMFGLFFTDTLVTNYTQAKGANNALFKQFFQAMLAQGIYLPPSPFEACFISKAHTQDELNHTLNAVEQAFSCLKVT